MAVDLTYPSAGYGYINLVNLIKLTVFLTGDHIISTCEKGAASDDLFRDLSAKSSS